MEVLLVIEMIKRYKHILFDLDHTLWDFEKNSRETLVELFQVFGLSDLGNFTCDQFCDMFQVVNNRLWDLYNQGKYDQGKLRSERFKMILTQLGVEEMQVPISITDEYLRICPTKPHVFPYALDVLKYLQDHYVLHILTNGFSDVQAIKLKSAGLTDFFMEVVTSDTTGFKKPSREIFQYLLKKIGADSNECIMIGDNLEADIKGARNAGIDCIFFNPLRIEHQEETTYEITCLSELKAIL